MICIEPSSLAASFRWGRACWRRGADANTPADSLGQLLLETDMPARKDDNLPAEVWRAELNNALSGIAQLKGIDRAELAEHIASTSRELLIR